MANDGQIVFEVTADGKHAIADIKEITRAIQNESKNWDKAADESTSHISNSFSSMLKKLVAGFSAVKIGKALLDIGKDAVQAASDLQEVQNVVDVTFGEGASKIETWSKNAATQFGLTETQAKRFTSTLGAMMKSSGLAGSQITEMSTDLAGLAADMASFYNLDFDEAFAKIRSGISGETEPLKQLGINLSVANLNAFALKQGLGKTFEQMTQGEQIMLRYQYLMNATADAQGDFARTSDGLANSRRMLETNLASISQTLGGILIPAVSEATSFVNELLKALQPDESKKTVVDRFAEMDLDTETKLQDIRKTAEEARLLTEELDRIGGEKTNTAGGKVQQLVDDLSNINLDQSKTNVVKDFISTLADNIDVVSGLTGKDAEGAAAWLESIGNAADKLDPNDAEGWSVLLNAIKAGMPGLENTEFGAAFFSALGGGFGDVTEQADTLTWMVEKLGGKTDKTAQEQELWLLTCKQLVKTIPGLSSIINAETGEIEGGTDAVREYIKAWEDGQTKLALMKAHEEKGNLLDQVFADLPGLQLEADLAAYRMKKAFNEVRDIYAKYGQNLGFDNDGNIDITGFYGITDEDLARLKKFKSEVEDTGLGKAYREASDELALRKQAYEDAKAIYAEEGEMLEEMPGNIDAAKDAQESWLESIGKTVDQIGEITETVENAKNAVKDLADYYEAARANVAESVNNAVKGLEAVETKAQEKTKDLTKELNKLGERTGENAEKFDELNRQINAIDSSTISAQGIGKNLESQYEYLNDYLEALEAARTKGIDKEILAQLSDGSVESYDYLAALASASDDEVQTINDNYKAVAEKKKALTDELTKQQLTVDETFQTLQEKAAEAVAALDMGQEAAENAGNTVSGLAQGISSHISEVQQAVDGIEEQLNRLDGWGFNIDLGGFGEISFTTSTGKKADTSGRFGIGYVPRDDYLIRAHEGERLLTAQENQIWNTLLNGGVSGFDLESLGGVMRDNIKPGGNVYLDGAQVGRVVSETQGRSYRSLQRSGWQG